MASSGFSVKTTVREIYSLDVDKNGDIITIDVVGNGFLYNMVRIIAGTLVFVGGGKINPNDMTDINKFKRQRKSRYNRSATRTLSEGGVLLMKNDDRNK